MRLDVKDMLADLVQTEKELAKAYCRAELESANRSVREELGMLQRNIQHSHAELFHEMHQRDWYKTWVAGQQQIESAIISWEQKMLKEPKLAPHQQH